MTTEKTAYLHGCHLRPDGTKDTFWTLSVPVKESLLWWQKAGLSYTASGYGSRIPTSRMVFFNGRWRRIYCRVYSNVGTCYIGNYGSGSGERITVSED